MLTWVEEKLRDGSKWIDPCLSLPTEANILFFVRDVSDTPDALGATPKPLALKRWCWASRDRSGWGPNRHPVPSWRSPDAGQWNSGWFSWLVVLETKWRIQTERPCKNTLTRCEQISNNSFWDEMSKTQVCTILTHLHQKAVRIVPKL